MARDVKVGKVDVECFDRFNRPDSKRKVACDPAEGMTHQEFKDECDINQIMARSLRSGTFPPAVAVGRYGDFSEAGDFQEAQELLARSEGQFAGLPAKVRERFKNDPAQFLNWVERVENLDEAQELGLLSEEAERRHVASKKPKSGDEPVK